MANTIRALFFGNSYTFRNDLSEVVKQLAEAGDPELTFEYTTVVYGGRTLENHWAQFQSQNIAALFGRSPEGLSIDRVIDPKVVDKDKPDVGPDGDPRECVFSDDMRTFLQKTAWQTMQDFGAMNRDA